MSSRAVVWGPVRDPMRIAQRFIAGNVGHPHIPSRQGRLNQSFNRPWRDGISCCSSDPSDESLGYVHPVPDGTAGASLVNPRMCSPGAPLRARHARCAAAVLRSPRSRARLLCGRGTSTPRCYDTSSTVPLSRARSAAKTIRWLSSVSDGPDRILVGSPVATAAMKLSINP